MVVNFSLATFTDPGFLPRGSGDNEDDFRSPVFKSIEINSKVVRLKWCVTCAFYRPPRCSHCSVCDACVEKFDHHCPWVNNCIGVRNYRYFFWFVTSLSLHMIFTFAQTVVYIILQWKVHGDDPMLQIKFYSSWVIVFVVCIALPLVGALTVFHFFLVLNGRTTNEQVTGKFKAGHNPFNNGFFTNVCSTLMGPFHPRYLHRKGQHTLPFTISTGDTQIRYPGQIVVDFKCSNGNKQIYNQKSQMDSSSSGGAHRVKYTPLSQNSDSNHFSQQKSNAPTTSLDELAPELSDLDEETPLASQHRNRHQRPTTTRPISFIHAVEGCSLTEARTPSSRHSSSHSSPKATPGTIKSSLVVSRSRPLPPCEPTGDADGFFEISV